jgi:hypothetical protein
VPVSRTSPTSRTALIRYVLIWAVIGTAAVVAGLSLIRATAEPSRRPGADPIATVVASGCVLTRPEGRQRRHTRPPVTGPPSAPASAGSHASAPSRAQLVGALRRGLVVVQYQPGVPAPVSRALGALLARVHVPLVLTPDRSGMPFAVAATAWDRLLGCSRVDARVVDALRTFATRYSGSGPDA